MLKMLKLVLLSTVLCASACGTTRPNISLGLNQITCPASLSEAADEQPELDAAFLAFLVGSPWHAYLIAREGGWEGIRADGEHAKADGLEACADANRRIAEARGEGSN